MTEFTKILNNQEKNFIQNLEKAYTEGVYSDNSSNRKLGRVGMSYRGGNGNDGNGGKDGGDGGDDEKRIKVEPYLSTKSTKNIVDILKKNNIDIEQKTIRGTDCYYFTVGGTEYGLEDHGLYSYGEDIDGDIQNNLNKLAKELNIKDLEKIKISDTVKAPKTKPGPLSRRVFDFDDDDETTESSSKKEQNYKGKEKNK